MMHKYAAAENSKITPFPATGAGFVGVSVVGARGYSGLELSKLLLQHPVARLTHGYASQDFDFQNEILTKEPIVGLAENQLQNDPNGVVFLATPAEASLKLAPKLLAQGKHVIDLSGAFRLKTSSYPQWYKFEHESEALLQSAEYGLMPFAKPTHKEGARLIANPGCYATAISLALIPLLQKNLIDASSIVIDAKSGTTGAGRKAQENLLFSEVDGECLPYRVGEHQHTPEIQEACAMFANASIDPFFATHLLAARRGIIASIYANTSAKSLDNIQAAYDEAFAGYPLVRHGRKISQLASLKNVIHTPFTHLSYEMKGGKLYLFSTIDNLLKGAASQAVENFNRLLDLPLNVGLTPALSGSL